MKKYGVVVSLLVAVVLVAGIFISFLTECKAESRPEADFNQLTNPKEREIVSLVANWPEVFAEAADILKPGTIASYLNSLADKYNSFYSSLRVLNAETPGLVGARLALVDAVRVVIRNGCAVLGIEAPERM